MFKKIIVLAAVACSALTLGVTASAATSSLTVVDEANDKVRITLNLSDTENNDEYILYVLNPGKTENNLKTASGNVKKILQYSEQKTGSGSELNFDFTVDTNVEVDGTDGLYTYIIKNSNGTVATDKFSYYSRAVKNEFISSIENDTSSWEATPAKVAENTYNYFGMQDFTLYTSVSDKDKVGELILNEIKNGGSAEKVQDYLKEATVVRALAEQSSQLLDENGKIKYISLMGLGEKYEKCYNESLNADGLKSVFEKSYDAEHTTIDTVRKNMEEQIVVSAVYNNVLIGSGHIEGLISTFKNDFVAFGLNKAKYDAYTAKGTAMKTLYNEGERTAKEMAARINELTASAVVPGSGGSSGGSGGSGGGSSSSNAGGTTGGGYIQSSPVASNSSTAEVVNKPIGFEDIDTVPWAADSINSLVEKGIVSGRDISTFAPNDTVTREEFATMLTKAFNMVDDNASASFNDVPKSRWSYPYVASGSSVGIMQGDGVNFYPQNNITRQDISAMIVRALMYKGLIGDMELEEDFCDDYNDIAEYARESVQVLYKNSIVSGDGTGCFRPANNATRAEAAVIISNAIAFAEKEGK